MVKNKDTINAILGDCHEDNPSTCHKNLGEQKRLRHWSRGHQFIVRGGGHIDTFQPLYKLVNIYMYIVSSFLLMIVMSYCTLTANA